MMMNANKWLVFSLLLSAASACGDAGGAQGRDAQGLSPSAHGSGISLALSSTGGTGAVYRLADATFVIEGETHWGEPLEPIMVTVDETTPEVLDIPVEPGMYTVRILPDWVLETSFEDSPFEPVDATLISPNPLSVWVQDFQSHPVRFDFVLGRTELELGINVSENGRLPPGYIPEGYDGVIAPTGDGRYSIAFANGGGACCWNSVQQARDSYPGSNLFLRE